MKLSRSIDVHSTIELKIEDCEGTVLTVRNCFLGSEISKIKSANAIHGRHEAIDQCTSILLKDWKGVVDADDKPIEFRLKGQIVDNEFFEIIPTLIKDAVYGHFIDTYLMNREELKN